jgi:hypothetical protein
VEASEVGLGSTNVEVLEETSLVLVLNLFMVAESLVALDHVATLRRDLVENHGSPDIALLDVVEALIAGAHKHIDVVGIAHLAVLAPVVSEVELGLLRARVLAVALPSNDERHVAAVLAEQTQRLEVSLNDRARLSCNIDR